MGVIEVGTHSHMRDYRGRNLNLCAHSFDPSTECSMCYWNIQYLSCSDFMHHMGLLLNFNHTLAITNEPLHYK